MMHTAEATSSMAPEQYGSRKCHKSIDLAVNKSLTNDLLRQLKWPDGTIYPNDAKFCYDLIGHTQATLAMQAETSSTRTSHVLFIFYTSRHVSSGENGLRGLRRILRGL